MAGRPFCAAHINRVKTSLREKRASAQNIRRTGGKPRGNVGESRAVTNARSVHGRQVVLRGAN